MEADTLDTMELSGGEAGGIGRLSVERGGRRGFSCETTINFAGQ
jgi:hypothetical protein